MKNETVYIGPARILTAPDVEDVHGAWEDLGKTRGEVQITIHSGQMALGRSDQQGSTPLSNSVYYLGQGVDITFPFAETSIEKLLNVAPQSVKNEAGGFENLGFGSLPEYVEEQAFAVIPEFVWRKDSLDEILKSPFVHWIRKGYVVMTGQIGHSLPEGDDAISDRSVECELRQTQELHTLNAGIGSLFLLDNPMNVMGSNNPTQLSVVAPDSALVTALNGAGINTIRELSRNTAPIDFSIGSISDATGIEFAVNTADINLSGNPLTNIPLFKGFTHLTNINLADGNISEEQASDFINEMWKIRESLGDNTATINVSGNTGLSQKAQDQVNGTGKFYGEGLVDYGVTVVT